MEPPIDRQEMHSTRQALASMLTFRQISTCRPCNLRAVPWMACRTKLDSAAGPPETEPNIMERLISNSTASTSDAQMTDVDASPVRNGQLQPGLYLVGTPIGNLEDITLRALRVLRDADIILAEDTRHSRKLLTHFGIEGQLVSFHEHNEKGKQEQESCGHQSVAQFPLNSLQIHQQTAKPCRCLKCFKGGQALPL